MKILMMGLTPPLEGGSEMHIYEISKRIESDVFTQKGSLCKNKIEFPLIDKPIFLRNVLFLLGSLIYTIYLLIRFNKKYELIHIHENLLYFLVPLLRIRYNVIVTVHGIRGFKFFDNKILWFFFRMPLKFANGLIAVNEIDRRELSKYFGNVTYIPNGVDNSIYDSIKVKVQSKISFIGRIHEQKGIVYLLEAFSMLKNSQFKLEIIGDDSGEYAKKLKEKFKGKNIVWAGFISDKKEIVRRLKSSYCIVLPSLWEGLPLTLFEALASERPVLVSDIPAFKSVLNKEAIFFKAKNSDNLANKINGIINNKKMAEKLGVSGKKVALLYDWSTIAKKTKKIYEHG